MCWFDIAIDICVAFGGLGTVGTLVFMIRDSMAQTKQLKNVQEIQSHQLDVLYMPDIRITGWSEALSSNCLSSKIWIENNGENLMLSDLKNTQENIVDKNKIQRCFPRHFDKGEQLTIPINMDVKNCKKGDLFDLVVENKLKQQFYVTISKVQNNIEITKTTKK